MGKRFNIRMALEADEPVLEVDKEAELTPEEKALREQAAITEADIKTPVEDDVPMAIAPKGDSNEDKSIKAVETDVEQTPTSASEVSETKSENDEESSSVDEAVDTAASLESIANILQNTLDTNGINAQTSKAVSLVLTSLYSNVGVKLDSKSYPALESFDSYSARKHSTQVAIENINDVIGRIWSAVVDVLARLAERIKDMVGKLVFMCRSYNSQIKVLRSNLNTIPGDAVIGGNGKFTTKSDIKNLTFGGRFDPITSLSVIGETFVGITKNINEDCRNNLSLIKNAFAISAFGDNEIAVPKLNTNPDIVFHGLKRVPHGESGDFVDHYTFTDLPGGLNIRADLPKENCSDVEYLQAIREMYIEIGTDGIIKGFNGDVDCFDTDSLGEVLDQCQFAVNKSMALFEEVTEVMNGNDFKVLTNIIDHFKAEQKARAEKASEEFYEAEDDRHILDVKKVITSYIRAIDKLYLSSAINTVTVCNRVISSGINYSDFCIRKYK